MGVAIHFSRPRRLTKHTDSATRAMINVRRKRIDGMDDVEGEPNARVIKASKHVRLGRGSPLASRGDQVEARPLGWGEAAWGDGRWDGPPQVIIPLHDGSPYMAISVLSTASAFDTTVSTTRTPTTTRTIAICSPATILNLLCCVTTAM